MGYKLTEEDVLRGGGKLPKLGKVVNPLVDSLACRIVGLLADAPTPLNGRKCDGRAWATSLQDERRQ